MNAQILQNPRAHPDTLTPRPVEKIAMHECPDLDAIAATLILREYGNQAFPGVKDAKIVFWGMNGTPDGRPASAWLEEDKVLAVDTGNGIFDEHMKTAKTGRMASTCATDLVAEFLGISELPELEKFLKFVNASDTKSNTHPWHIASMIKTKHSDGKDPREVVAWAESGLQAFLNGQRRFHGAVREEFFNGKMFEAGNLSIAVVVSDHPEMNRFARSQKVDVLIQRNSEKHTIIFGTEGVRMRRMVNILRYEELRAEGKPIPAGLDLSAPLALEEVPEWYLTIYDDYDMVSNGTRTHPNVPRSKLSLEKITMIVLKSFRRHN